MADGRRGADNRIIRLVLYSSCSRAVVLMASKFSGHSRAPAPPTSMTRTGSAAILKARQIA